MLKCVKILFVALLSTALRGQQLVPQTLATDLKSGYQVLAADLNGDGRPDLVALASGLPNLDWFENPGTADKPWPRHTLATGFRQLINVAYLAKPSPHLLVAHEFSNVPSKSLGVVSVLTPGQDPRQQWSLREIHRLPTSHRLRTVNGVFVNAPLSDPATTPPDYRGQIPLTTYPDLVPRVISSADSGVMHGIYVTDFDGDGREDILTASFTGIHWLRAKADGSFERKLLHAGSPKAWPLSGSSDVTVVRAKGKKYLASIDPWHGNEFSLYTPKGSSYTRQVLDEKLSEGHTVLAVDLDGDGNEEVIYGARREGGSLRMARLVKGKWKIESILEGKIGTASCVAADFDGDRRTDIACIGSASQNLILLHNRK
jgi:hypothetical protein